MIPIIDVSWFQGTITLADARQIRAQGKRGVFVRCAEALSQAPDPRFAANVAAFTTAGLPVGVYCPLHPDLDPVAQAESHFAMSKGLGFAPGSFSPWADIELLCGKSPAEVLAASIAYCGRYRELLGRKVTVYTYRDFDHANLSKAAGDDSALADTFLSMAAYQPEPPAAPEPWTPETMKWWQKSGGVAEPGVPVYHLPNGTPCDYGFFLGDEQAFADALDPAKG